MLRLKLLLAGLLGFIFVTSLYAGTYLGLQPGVAQKKETDRILGAPVKEVEAGRRYDYAGQKHDLKQISVVFNQESGKIEAIYLYFQQNYRKSQLKEWLKLDSLARTGLDAEGNLIEYYIPEGIALYFSGPQDSSEVKFLSHFDTAVLQEKKAQKKKEVETIPVEESRLIKIKKPYLGVEVKQYPGQGIKIISVREDSPAQAAGLKSNDLILELGDRTFYYRDISALEFLRAVQEMPVDTPLRLLIERAGRKIETNVSLAEIEKEVFSRVSADDFTLADANYQKAVAEIKRGNFRTAIEYLKMALKYNPTIAFYYNEIAYCYLQNGQGPLGIPYLEKALSIEPHYYAYYLLGYIHWNKQDYDRAIGAFENAIGFLAPRQKEPVVFALLGSCYLQKGLVEKALEMFRRAYSINSNDPLTVYNLALCLDRLGNTEEAIAFYRKYLRMHHNDPVMNNYARYRYETLYKPTASKIEAQTSENFRKIFDHVMNEMKEFNKE